MIRSAPVEVFPPGEFMREELEARGWTVEEFAAMLDYPPTVVADLIEGKRRISRRAATRIGKVFGTGPELWTNLEATYRQVLDAKLAAS